MRLTVIGCSGSGPSATSSASCYLIEQDGYRLVLDLGSGALTPLLGRVAGADIDAIALSHLHADHCLDMVPLAVRLNYGPAHPPVPIPVLAPAGTPGRLASANYPGTPESFFTGWFQFIVADDFTTGDRRRFELGPFTVTTAPMNHPVPTVGFRLEAAGRSLAYSGDTGPSATLVELAAAADVLLCEASWAGGAPPQPDLHLTGAPKPAATPPEPGRAGC